MGHNLVEDVLDPSKERLASGIPKGQKAILNLERTHIACFFLHCDSDPQIASAPQSSYFQLVTSTESVHVTVKVFVAKLLVMEIGSLEKVEYFIKIERLLRFLAF